MGDGLFWLGTYTGGQGTGRGIYRMRRAADGGLAEPELAAELANPSYLALHPDGGVLYAVSELTEGAIAAFAVEDGHRLRPLGTRPVPADPCHLAVAPDGSYLAVACYTAGAVALQRLAPDGGLHGDPKIFQGEGHGPDPSRQEGPHAHMVAFAGDGTLWSTDLGTDRIRQFRITGGGPLPGGEVRLPAGSGPRHLVTHPSGHVYLVAELGRSVIVLRPEGGAPGGLDVLTESPAMHGEPTPEALSAAIRTGADGRFVYTTTRGPDVITTLEVLDGGSRLRPISDYPCEGRWPRDLWVDGDVAYAANQFSENVTIFHLDPDLGVPEYRGAVAAPTPVCLIPG
ncbi:MAG: beta-propeller fold lactonase family protein [Streptosporangiales bacterium]|nr:beta-propeller fold lactonase family protein [Streptosporangiales bacterium]